MPTRLISARAPAAPADASASMPGSEISCASAWPSRADDARTFHRPRAHAMTEITAEETVAKQPRPSPAASGRKTATVLTQHVVEVISDSGEGAQRCGQALGAIAARMGNGVWTVEIIPAEIRPPARSVAGASGNRIRLGSRQVTNGGDETDLVVAFNEQVLLGRVRASELKPGCIILLECMWRDDADPKIADSYTETYERLVASGYTVYEVPMERACRAIIADARRGKN